MSRAHSYNWELQFDGKTIYPESIGEIGEGTEGLIEVADGNRKYKIRDQIMAQGEVECVILIKDDRYEYDAMQAFASSGKPRDVFVVGRNSAGEAKMTFLLANCDCVWGAKSAFDRKGKSADTKKYQLIPEFTTEVKA